MSTGNVCRSPMAERLAELELAAALGAEVDAFRIGSAGTWGHDGAPMEQHARAVLNERGARAGGFVAQELLAEQIAAADLVLTASSEQSQQVRLMDPAARDRVFTLCEFASLAQDAPPDVLVHNPAARARALVCTLAELRTRLGSAVRSTDIADPYGAPLHVFRLCADEIAACLGALVGHLAVARTAATNRAVS
ncbi:MAG TPA: hypothetical protein VHU88_07945 [Sporichthyaceae bacterium]|nr:hypothetical protein [Sporichthyaceae bacterium]